MFIPVASMPGRSSHSARGLLKMVAKQSCCERRGKIVVRSTVPESCMMIFKTKVRLAARTVWRGWQDWPESKRLLAINAAMSAMVASHQLPSTTRWRGNLKWIHQTEFGSLISPISRPAKALPIWPLSLIFIPAKLLAGPCRAVKRRIWFCRHCSWQSGGGSRQQRFSSTQTKVHSSPASTGHHS